MSHVLYAVANATGQPATLRSKEHPNDDVGIPSVGVRHTGGGDNNWIFLPDCSDDRYWADHHISVTANDGSWIVTFWVNDQDGRLLYWSDFDGYSTQNPVPGSRDVTDCSLMIVKNGPKPQVVWQPW